LSSAETVLRFIASGLVFDSGRKAKCGAKVVDASVRWHDVEGAVG